jgi:hypothetical protein
VSGTYVAYTHTPCGSGLAREGGLNITASFTG